MAKTFDAPFPQTIKTGTAVTTAVATHGDDAPANTVALGPVAGAEGAVRYGLSVMARATNTLGAALLFVSSDSGTTKRLIQAKVIAAQTISTTVPPTPVDFGYTSDKPLRLAAGEQLYVGTTIALVAGYAWRTEGADF